MKRLLFILLLVAFGFCETKYNVWIYVNKKFGSMNCIECRYATYDQRNVIILIPREKVYSIEKIEEINKE